VGDGSLEHEMAELRFEVERHHRDFGRISVIVEHALATRESTEHLHALREIRGIVG